MNKRHGMRYTSEYIAWMHMKARCTNPSDEHWHNYGGRGIKVCEQWIKFENFYADMGPRPGPGYSLDRYPDNDGDYVPGNVRWATRKEQAINRRSTVLLTWNGKTQSIQAWSDELGIPTQTLNTRLRSGYDAVRALSQPIRGRK